tara:strand:- start:187 stop:456 length:270 start_codon:yes stop_codon:yes gene_type:complete
MKTKLLRKIRKSHPVTFDRQLRLYKYETKSGRYTHMGVWEPTYNSGWERISKLTLSLRRSLILEDAKAAFSKSIFHYKRKRKPRYIKVF